MIGASCSLSSPYKHTAAGAAQTPQTTAKPHPAQPPCPHPSRLPQPAPGGQRGQHVALSGLDAAVASSGPSRPTQPAAAASTRATAAVLPVALSRRRRVGLLTPTRLPHTICASLQLQHTQGIEPRAARSAYAPSGPF